MRDEASSGVVTMLVVPALDGGYEGRGGDVYRQ